VKTDLTNDSYIQFAGRNAGSPLRRYICRGRVQMSDCQFVSRPVEPDVSGRVTLRSRSSHLLRSAKRRQAGRAGRAYSADTAFNRRNSPTVSSSGEQKSSEKASDAFNPFVSLSLSPCRTFSPSDRSRILTQGCARARCGLLLSVPMRSNILSIEKKNWEVWTTSRSRARNCLLSRFSIRMQEKNCICLLCTIIAIHGFVLSVEIAGRKNEMLGLVRQR